LIWRTEVRRRLKPTLQRSELAFTFWGTNIFATRLGSCGELPGSDVRGICEHRLVTGRGAGDRRWRSRNKIRRAVQHAQAEPEPDWPVLRGKLFMALRDFPDALEAVKRALE
jgi:hypothetical protein